MLDWRLGWEESCGRSRQLADFLNVFSKSDQSIKETASKTINGAADTFSMLDFVFEIVFKNRLGSY
jgi:hypothetical protein